MEVKRVVATKLNFSICISNALQTRRKHGQHKISIQSRIQSNSNQSEVFTAFSTESDKKEAQTNEQKVFHLKTIVRECLLHFKVASLVHKFGEI